MDPERQATPLAGRTVLLIEDEYYLADDLLKALAAAGAKVVGPFGDISEGLAAVESGQNLHCAVLDINLRDTPVYPVAGALRRRGIPFVFTTGYDKASVPAEFQDVPHYEKPIDTMALIRLLGGL